MQTLDQQPENGAEADFRFCSLVLPERLARLINPHVIAKRAEVVRARADNAAEDRVRRRLCAEVVAQFLLKQDTKENLDEAA